MEEAKKKKETKVEEFQKTDNELQTLVQARMVKDTTIKECKDKTSDISAKISEIMRERNQRRFDSQKKGQKVSYTEDSLNANCTERYVNNTTYGFPCLSLMGCDSFRV